MFSNIKTLSLIIKNVTFIALIILTCELYVAYGSNTDGECPENANANMTKNLADLRMVIIGKRKVGKSSLANVLLGRHPYDDTDEINNLDFECGCFAPRQSTNGKEVDTKDTCYDTQSWLGVDSNEMVTIVDTPGFGGFGGDQQNFSSLKKEHAFIDGIADKLKNDIQYVNAFVIAFRHDVDNRMTREIADMILVFKNMFGEEFWNHVIVEITRWGHDQKSIEDRDEQNKSETKQAQDWNKIFMSEPFNSPHELPFVFIDSHYNTQIETNSDGIIVTTAQHVQEDTEAFNNNTEVLFNFLQNSTKFNLTGISAVKTELGRMLEEIQELKRNRTELERELEEIKNRSPVTFKIPIYKTVTWPVYERVTRIVRKNVTVFVDRPIVTPAPQNDNNELVYSNGTFIGFGIGMCILGICIGALFSCFVSKKKSNGTEENENEDEENNSKKDDDSHNGDEEEAVPEEMQKLNDTKIEIDAEETIPEEKHKLIDTKIEIDGKETLPEEMQKLNDTKIEIVSEK